MKKIELLFNELSKIKNKNRVKLFIMEIIILLLVFGSFLMDISFQYKIIILVVLSIIFLMILVLYLKKQKMISYSRNHYQNHPLDVIQILEKRKTYFLDIFDFTNETLIFKEIIRTLKTYRKYQDKFTIGPWDIIYNHHKTKVFSENLILKNKSSINQLNQKIENIAPEVKTLLKSLGIDYHKIYNTWERKIGGKSNCFELMYPVYGLILNDSQVLSHGLKYKIYQINDVTSLKPYETQIENEDVIMLHIKVQF
ncbi:hypothetical protein KHQ81_02270 [Mycoplasmatota bacterium]|nr:hypothetical protein KHQ81_02270 [Mycoplasmatota bacterium]